MKRFFLSFILMAAMLAATGCVPHTTGETEVGVRTRKMAFSAPRVLKSGSIPRVPPTFSCRSSTIGMYSIQNCRTWR